MERAKNSLDYVYTILSVCLFWIISYEVSSISRIGGGGGLKNKFSQVKAILLHIFTDRVLT